MVTLPLGLLGNIVGLRLAFEWKGVLLTVGDGLVIHPVKHGELCQGNTSTGWVWYMLLALSSFAALSPGFFFRCLPSS